MLQRLVVRICSVWLTLYRSYFWAWERHLSGVVASVLEEYAASMFMVNVTGSTSPLICHVGLNSVCVWLVVNDAGTAGCLEGVFIMVLVNFFVRNGNTWWNFEVHSYSCKESLWVFIYMVCCLWWYSVVHHIRIVTWKFVGCQTYNLLIESTDLLTEYT